MITEKERSYYAAADLLRILSIGLVAWFHIWQQSWLNPGFMLFGHWIDLQRIVSRGYMMVDLMLLLSGFLLYLPYIRRVRQGRPGLEVREFYQKRLIRILPSYLFSVLIAFLYAYICNNTWGGRPFLWKDLLLHLSFTQTFTYPTYLWSSLNVALWTLCIEMQFYLIFPLVGRAFSGRPGLTFGLMLALAFLWRGWVYTLEDPSIYFNQLPGMLDLYAFGMLAAHILTEKKPERRWWNGLGAGLCLLGILTVMWQQSPSGGRELQWGQMNARLPLGALGCGFLLFGCQWPERLERLAGNPVTRFLAGISYNFYIWHQYLAVRLKEWHLPDYTAAELPQATEGLLWQRKYTLFCVLAAFAAAIIGTYLVEKPFTRLGRELLRRKRAEKLPERES